MKTVKRYVNLIGTCDQANEMFDIIVNIGSVKVKILEQKIIYQKTNPEDKRELYYMNLEVVGSTKDLDKVIEIIKDSQNLLFKELSNFVS